MKFLILATVAIIAIVGVVLIAWSLSQWRQRPTPPPRARHGKHAAPPEREPQPADDEGYYGEDYEDAGGDDPRFMERPPEIAAEPPEFLTAPVTAVEIPGYLTESVELNIPAYEAALRDEWPAPDRPTGIPIAEVSHGEWLPPTPPPDPEPLPDGHASAPYYVLPSPLAPGLAALSSLASLIAPAAQAEAEQRKAEAEAELLQRNMEDFPHLFDPATEYSEWKWDTDSGILNVRALREQLAAEEAAKPAPRKRRERQVAA